MVEARPTNGLESEQLGAVRAAVQVGIDDLAAGDAEFVNDPQLWVDQISAAVSTATVA